MRPGRRIFSKYNSKIDGMGLPAYISSRKEELLNLGIHFQPWQLELFKQISTWSGLNPYKYK